jgi:hypothetical protein
MKERIVEKNLLTIFCTSDKRVFRAKVPELLGGTMAKQCKQK